MYYRLRQNPDPNPVLDINVRLDHTSPNRLLYLLPHVQIKNQTLTSLLKPELSLKLPRPHQRLLQAARNQTPLRTLFDQGGEIGTTLTAMLTDGLLTIGPPVPPLPSDPKEKWLVLAPHLDDAALSVGGVLLQRSNNVELVISSFTSTYRYSDSILCGNIGAVTRLRHQEEELFCNMVGARKVDGGLDDADIRVDGIEPFRLPTAHELDLHRDLADRLFHKEKPDRIYAPMGVGGHADHVSLHAAIIELIAAWRSTNPAVRVFIYEDLPYASISPCQLLDGVRRLKESQRVAPVFEDITEILPDKLWSIGIYQSQTVQTFQACTNTHAKNMGQEMNPGSDRHAERLWELTSAT